MVDDCSSNPDTWKTMRAIAEENSNVRAVQLMKNSGRAAAVLCGFTFAQGQYVITMDDDLQHRPEDIPALVVHQAHDVAMADFPHKKHSFEKVFTSWIKGWFDSIILRKPRDLTVTSFILLNKKVVDAMLQVKTHQPIIVALLFQTTIDIVSVPVTHDRRAHGKSDFNLWKRTRQFAYLLINNSTFLPRTLAILGFGLFLSSLVFSIVILIRYFSNKILIPGWTSLILVTLMSNGTILLGLGILGEYLGRIFAGIEQRPPYVIRNVVTHISEPEHKT